MARSMPAVSKPNVPYCGALARAAGRCVAWPPAATATGARETVAAARIRVRMRRLVLAVEVCGRAIPPLQRRSIAGRQPVRAAAPFARDPPAPDEDRDQPADQGARQSDDEQADDQSRCRIGGEPGQPVRERRAVL